MYAISILAPGSIVKIIENGTPVNFLVLCHDYPESGRTLLLRKDLYNQQPWNTSGVNTYSGSSVDTWLSNTYLNMLAENVRTQIAPVSIEYTPGGGNNTVSNLSRQVFLLSYTEVCFSGSPRANVEGEAIPYLNSNETRLALLGGVGTRWMLRTPTTDGTTLAWGVHSDGSFNSGYNEVTLAVGVRPAFTVPSNTAVDTDGTLHPEISPSASPLSDIQPGSIVKINESSAPANFIVLCHDYPAQERTLLLRNDLYNRRQWDAGNINAYDGSDIDVWLTNTYYNLLDAEIREQIAPVTIEYTIGNGDTSQGTLNRRVFLLSYTEMGFSGDPSGHVEGEPIPYFDSDAKRIGRYNGTAQVWWLRSAHTGNTSLVWLTGANGQYAAVGASTNQYSRPAFTVPSSMVVDDDGSLLPNAAPAPPAQITVPQSVQTGEPISITWSASTDPEGESVSYVLERSVNSGEYVQIYAGANTSYSDTISYPCTVKYRVAAADASGAQSDYTISNALSVTMDYSNVIIGGDI